MTKLLQNKSIIKFLGIALSILLIVALVPQINIAYGSKDDVLADTPPAEAGDNAPTEGEEGAEGVVDTSGEAGSQPGDIDPKAGAIEGEELPESDGPSGGTLEEPQTRALSVETQQNLQQTVASRAAKGTEKELGGNSNYTISENTINTKSPLVFNKKDEQYTLTINEGVTLKSDIKVTNGAKLTIQGKGTIEGYGDEGQGSVIIVQGKNNSGTKLTVNGPTITGGTGATQISNLSTNWGKVGGGILVCRDGDGTRFAALEFKSGTVENNTANAGGGIFVGYRCGLNMSGGSVLNNTADPHEGGGIFFDGNWDGGSNNYGHISKGTIKGNKTLTKTDWGGGGVYINNEGILQIDSATITNNTAKSLGGGVAGCPHAKIGIGTVDTGAAIYGNEANGKDGPLSPVLIFNTPPSLVSSDKKAPSGDFLVQGLTTDKITQLLKIYPNREEGVGKYIPANGEYITYGSYKLMPGSYGKDLFDSDLASDYYCTLGSYIAGTNLCDHSNGMAWEGFVASFPANKIKNGTVTEKAADGTPNWFASKIAIPVNESYEVHDATLCLKNTAKKDNSGKPRKVIIEDNTSDTHGGGVSCNGVLKFGHIPDKEEVVNSYTLTLNKEILNSITNEPIALGNDTFNFTLKDENGKAYNATSDSNGTINFMALPGSKQNGVTKEFTLTENLTDDQIAAGFTPKEDIEVKVKLDVSKETAKYMDKENRVVLERTTYTTTVSNVMIDNENTSTVTNILDLKTSAKIPVIKIADGIAQESFSFCLKEITGNINEVVNDPNGNVALKDGVNLAEQALVEPNRTVIITPGDATSAQKTDTAEFTFEYTPKSISETHWYAIAEQAGATPNVSYDDTAYLVKVDVSLSGERSLDTSEKIYKAVPGSRKLEEVTGDNVGVTFENVAIKYAGFELPLTKQILTTLGKNLPLNDRKFSFDLYEGDNSAAEATSVVKGATTDPKTGKLNLQIADGKYAKEAFEGSSHEKEFTFTLKETPLEGDVANFMTTIKPATVKVTLTAVGERTSDENGRGIYLVTPTVKTVTVNGTDVEVANNDITVTNRYAPNGTWQFRADKFFYGLGEPRDCSFTMQEIERAPEAGEPLANVLVSNDNLQNWTANIAATDFEGGKAKVVFDSIDYQVTTPKADDVDEAIPTSGDDRGDHYYLVTEDGDDAAKDTTAYVVKVTVAVDENDPAKLTATETLLGYADDLDSALNPLTLSEGERPAFYNTDTYDLISAASYSVYAASGEPVDQVCYVDPKIIKNLEGRAIKSGEFAFKLIQVANYNDTEGELISATTNDEFGMVDFDKANNVSGDLENPSCLAYTKPGTYYYRVIEDTSKGGMNDQSVLYSDQVITFTTVIKQDEATGQLVCTDMYYGWWDAATNQNVRFDEQYADYETQPGNIGDMSKLNPDWHPTINNKARPMDLQVRKTSVSDRDEGLVGATYALYMVNENPQGDIWLAEATSEEGGWITYKNVSLATNNLYYFKETAAPAGHTVSEFRSPYFYLVEDATSANGYALKYTDTKYFDAAEVEAAAIPMAAAEAQAMQADIAAQAEAVATDDQTQPGHSADGNILLTYDKDGGVYDETTQVEVNKLDTRTHEWVEGAKLVILEKESGKEVASWTSDKAPQKLAKTLNVGITYLLREVEAPGEYRLANDVEFVIDNYGNVTITKGTENGNAELSDNTITLYDTMMDAEEVEQRERETTREVPLGTILAQTGDMLPILGIGAIVLASLIALIVAGRRRHEGKDDKN